MKKQSSGNTYVALLRGINVGGNSIISMADLKACFTKLGFADVKSFINSGNIIFKSSDKNIPALTKKIEAGIKKHCRMDIKVTLRNQKEIAAICKKIPAKWVTDKLMRTDVMFLWPNVDRKTILADIPNNPEVDKLIYTKGAVIWNLDRANYKKSKVPKMIGSEFYKSSTARNSNTTRKLLQLML